MLQFSYILFVRYSRSMGFFFKFRNNLAKTCSKCPSITDQIFQEQIQNNQFDVLKKSASSEAELLCYEFTRCQ